MSSGPRASPSPPGGGSPRARAAWTAQVLALLAALAWVLARTAWMSDDAYVTLRTIDHFVAGRGLVYNAVERVQAYTHPLWMMLLVVPYAVTHDAWRMPMAAGAGLTLLGAGLLAFRAAASRQGAVVALAVLVASKAYVDWGTGGLENPLENLLLVLFAIGLARERPKLPALALLAGLLGLTRLDGLLLVLPALALVAVSLWRRGERGLLLAAFLGLAPLVLWHAFALVYYGTPWPNTAYAKLGTGVPASMLIAQGFRWLRWNLWCDPITLVALAAGVVVGVRSRDLRDLGLVLGIGLHLAYAVSIGGDFMAGRFLVAPLVLAVLLLARDVWTGRAAIVLATVTVGASLLNPYAPLRSGPHYRRADAYDGIADERGYYWKGTGWWAPRKQPGPNHEFVRDGRAAAGLPVALKTVIGLYGFHAGPDHHVVDRVGLADPLLARLPAQHSSEFRVGHFRRKVPGGYLQSVRSSRNGVREPEARELYDLVRLATRGPLFTVERWQAIRRLHLGELPTFDREAWRYGEARWLGPGSGRTELNEYGAGVRTAGLAGTLVFEVSEGSWEVWVEEGDRVLQRYEARSPIAVPADGTDRVLVFPPEEKGVVERVELQ